MKRETTAYVEDDLLRAMRVAVARAGKRNYEIVEDALRAYVGRELLERVAHERQKRQTRKRRGASFLPGLSFG